MRAYVARRVLLGIIVLLGVSAVTFMVARVLPSEPAARWVGPRATAEQIARARVELGLDRPLHIQYYRYMRDLLRGNWGVSIRTHQPVIRDIKTFLPATLELTLAGMLIAFVIGLPLGVLSARRKDRFVDHLSRTASIAGVSLPTFWLGMILQLVFFKRAGWLPLGGRIDPGLRWTQPLASVTGMYLLDAALTGNWAALRSSLAHMILPAATLAGYPLGLITRMVRSSMLETLNEDYILLSRAYGIPERLTVYRYALKNALGPTITVVALSFAYSLTGTFLIEAVFNWPGLGHYAAMSIISLDYPAIMGVTLLVAVVYVFLNLAVDLLHALLDPRIRVG